MEKYKLMNLSQALQQIHFPSSLFLAQKAKERFIFESLLLSQIFLLKNKKRNSLIKAPQINLDVPLLQKFVKSLPFTLTDCQKKAIWEIAKNLNQSPMNRLLEGEVGQENYSCYERSLISHKIKLSSSFNGTN